MNPQLRFVSPVSACEHRTVSRTLQDLADVFCDPEAVRSQLSQGNPVIYEFHEYVASRRREDLVTATCTLLPGKVGREFHMTRGHFHDPADFAEVYYVQSGKGLLLMQSREGHFLSVDMRPGTILYVPPVYFHRTANVGPEPLVFFGVFCGETDHDYGKVPVAEWFAKIVVDIDGAPRVIDNPRRVIPATAENRPTGQAGGKQHEARP